MRSRNIKIGFWENDDLGLQIDTVRILFIGLWCIADREGKLEGNVSKIRHLLFGYQNKQPDVNRYLTVLERLRFIQRYEVDGVSYILIPNFRKHQTPHNTEKSRNLPDYQPSPLGNGCVTESKPLRNLLNPESGTLNPEPGTLNKGFVVFYEAYPKKVGKQDALKAWIKLNPENGLNQKILSALEVHKKSDQWCRDKGKYIPHPASWLNKKRWEDEIKTEEVECPVNL